MDFEQEIKNCVTVLAQGGVILYPTDTVWGMGCDATNEAAIDKIFALKNRPKEKSLIVLLADARDILHYVATPPPDIISIAEDFTSPTTVIYQQAIGFAENAIHADGSIAIRVTKDPFCMALIKRFRKPLVSTSANWSGQPTPAIFKEINPALIASVDYTVQYRQEETEPKQSSRLIKIADDGGITVLR